MTTQLKSWQVDLILDALDVLADLESGDGTNDDYDPAPINTTKAALLASTKASG